jgi:hypothetical protein
LNALRHGLATTTLAYAGYDSEVSRLAARLAGEHDDEERRHWAMMAAQAQIDLLRALEAKRSHLEAEFAAARVRREVDIEGSAVVAALPMLVRLQRYEDRARARRRRALQFL